MKLALLLLAAAALAAASAQAQVIKSLGYNTTNGNVIYSGTNALTFTNALSFGTNAAATTRTNLGLGASNSVTFATALIGKAISPSLAIGGGEEAFLHIITEQQGEIQIGWGPDDSEYAELALTLEQTDWKFYKPFSVPNATNRAIIRTNLSLGLPALTNTSNVTTMRALAGSTNTNQPFSGTFGLLDINQDIASLTFSNGILIEALLP